MNLKYKATALSQEMAKMAAKYPNHDVSNALSRVAQKLESYGSVFAQEINELDKKVIRFYHQHKHK